MNSGRALLIGGAVGAAVCAFGWSHDPRQFAFSYLFAFMFWAGLALGSLGLLMIHHLTGGGWGFAIRRYLEAGIGTLPLLAIGFMPLFLGLHQLYPWARPGAHGEALLRKAAYLNTTAFAVRAAVLFGAWILIETLLRRWSREQEHTEDLAPTRRMRTLSGPGIVLFAVLGTVAAVDWLMVLENNWHSTIFPILMMIGQMLSALALSIALLSRQTKDTAQLPKLGNLLLAFVMLWAYMSVSQLIIIWSGNLPRETTWYLHRVAGGWKAVAIFLALVQFAVPFALLLGRETKRRPAFLGAHARGLLGVHAVEIFWQVAPSLHPEGLAFSVWDPVAFVTLGCFWSAAFGRTLRQSPTLPSHDPRMEAIHV